MYKVDFYFSRVDISVVTCAYIGIKNFHRVCVCIYTVVYSVLYFTFIKSLHIEA